MENPITHSNNISQTTKEDTIWNTQNKKRTRSYFLPKPRFDIHINGKINKANATFGLLRPTFSSMDADILLTLYKALCRCHLDYNIYIRHAYVECSVVGVIYGL